ncbi:MAG: hypothetical protein ACKOF3_08430, partial [Spartobacteria bacterium]
FRFLAPWNAKPYSTGVSFSVFQLFPHRPSSAISPQTSAEGLFSFSLRPPLSVLRHRRLRRLPW